MRAYLAGQCIRLAVRLLRTAGALTPNHYFREDIRQALRGLWDAGLHSRDIDGKPAGLIPARSTSHS